VFIIGQLAELRDRQLERSFLVAGNLFVGLSGKSLSATSGHFTVLIQLLCRRELANRVRWRVAPCIRSMPLQWLLRSAP